MSENTIQNEMTDTVSSIRASCHDKVPTNLPTKLGKDRSLSFTVDKDGTYVVSNPDLTTPNDSLAVLAMGLLMLETHWKRQFLTMFKECGDDAKRASMKEDHHWDMARIERARAWLNNNFDSRQK